MALFSFVAVSNLQELLEQIKSDTAPAWKRSSNVRPWFGGEANAGKPRELRSLRNLAHRDS